MKITKAVLGMISLNSISNGIGEKGMTAAFFTITDIPNVDQMSNAGESTKRRSKILKLDWGGSKNGIYTIKMVSSLLTNKRIVMHTHHTCKITN